MVMVMVVMMMVMRVVGKPGDPWMTKCLPGGYSLGWVFIEKAKDNVSRCGDRV
jgi:hypothetical protein